MRSAHRQLILCLLLSCCSQLPPGQAEEPPAAEDLAFFEAKIRPVLVEHCYRCHAADASIIRGGLQVDSRDALLQGGDSGPALVPGQPAESLLLQALKHESLQMPPDKRLPATVIADFEEWIRRGAPDPRTQRVPARLQPVDWEAARQHWAFQPISDPAPPAVGDSAWVQNPVDQFILQRLTATGLTPAPPADKRTLIRRATMDLIGLPPTVEEVHQFLADDSPDAFAKVVDRLLASPHYGERWGRHWLDLVRYADTNGADENHQFPVAWRYRDWVVRMLNQDLPLDQFIVQQLAGDLLPAPADEQAAADLLTATGMLVVGPKMLAEQDKDKMLIDIVDEQIDTVSRTLLGLTVACARCHDHKFDPISTRDYYALAGIFHSTQTMADRAFVSKWMERPLPSADISARRAAHQQKLDAAQAELAQLEAGAASGSPSAPGATAPAAADATAATATATMQERITAQKAVIEQLTKELPQFDMVMATQEGQPANLPVHIRGNHLTPGPEPVPRGMPELLTSVAAAAPIDASRSGRLELAQWLTAPAQPLTRRVLVNRLWMWHFGEPLMRSPSNWGLQAEPPSHPELLDWLAQELLRRNWSLKEMHRLLLLSATWQMDSRSVAAAEQIDPENRLLWRQNRRRLEAEQVRDAVLFVGGGLDRSFGQLAADTNAPRRAIYLPINRSALYEMFSTFDYVETANHIEQRPVTTVPQQALFLLNSSLVHEQARQLSAQVLEITASAGAQPAAATAAASPVADAATSEQTAEQQVSSLFERLYSRLPTEAEVQRALQFVQQAEATLAGVADPAARRLQAWASLTRTLIAANEFIYID